MSIDFESLKDKAVVLAQSGVNKTRELADAGVAKVREISEIAKLKVRNSTEQEAIRKAYSDLGKLYYAEHGSAPEAACADLCQRITDALARISYNNERIADIKAAGRTSDSEADANVEVEAGEFVSETPCCCAEEAEAAGPCCCAEEAEAAGPCCCTEEPAAEELVSETPCCCGTGEPGPDDDKTEE